VLDFTSSLYLGFGHASSDLPAWPQLTLGKPAALEELPGIPPLERELASLTGCEEALVAPSTLHLFWDLFAILASRNTSIFLDRGSYPIAQWGVERAAALGVQVRSFPQHDVEALTWALSKAGRTRPVIVTDGLCPSSGAHAPLADYADCAAAQGGVLVVDDTQALGVFGPSTGASSPYGEGGGGSLKKFGLRHPGIVVVSSLAKAFGVPIAMLGGSARLVQKFRENSKTRMHCSPPSATEVGAACHALEENRRVGEALRSKLGQRVAYFRRVLKSQGVLASRSLFPVQPLRLPEDMDVRAFYRDLFTRGIKAVLLSDSRGTDAHCSFVLTARHRLVDIDKALEVLERAIAIARGDKRREMQWVKQNQRAGRVLPLNLRAPLNT
jgi:8-amino-7-oxononanoate synthase